MASIGVGVANAIWQGGWTIDGVGAASRITARLAFLLFILAWTAQAMAKRWPGGWRAALLRRRRALGLAFAGVHGVHLVALSIGMFVFGRDSSLISVIGGGFAYVIIAFMALTSHNSMVHWMGPARWRAFHSAGGWVVAGVFAFTYAGRIGSRPDLAFFGLGVLALALAIKFLPFRLHRHSSTA